jgi:hypothetical protein
MYRRRPRYRSRNRYRRGLKPRRRGMIMRRRIPRIGRIGRRF